MLSPVASSEAPLHIYRYEAQGFELALRLEKKKRSRGKRLNLLGEEDVGPQLFSPSRIALARLHQTEKAEAERQRKQEIERRKAQAAAIREQKGREKEDRRAARAIARQLSNDEKARQQAERLVQRHLGRRRSSLD